MSFLFSACFCAPSGAASLPLICAGGRLMLAAHKMLGNLRTGERAGATEVTCCGFQTFSVCMSDYICLDLFQGFGSFQNLLFFLIKNVDYFLQLQPFLNANSILEMFQSGFKALHCTKAALQKFLMIFY